MEQYIKKSAIIAEIERRIKSLNKDRDFNYLQIKELEALLSFLDTLETKDVQEPKRRMTDKERIREEIERLHEEYRGKKGDADVRRALRTVLFFIDSMQEEPKSTERKINYGKSAEWGEEDENRINRLIAYFEDKESFTAEDDIAYANWLKTLRPQNHWKPSEEQLEFLQKCIEAYNEVSFPTEVRVLSSLYNDLKKLK